MALCKRIFPHRDKKSRWGRGFRSHKKDCNFLSPELLTSFKNWQSPDFDPDQIRLLVFNESDGKGRKLLFDSKAIRKNEQKAEPSPRFGSRLTNSPASGPPSPCPSLPDGSSPVPNGDINSPYSFLRPSSDVKLLGEMMYGSVAMSYQGSTVKVHTIRSPPELMLSQVFVLRPKENHDQDTHDRDNVSIASEELMIPRMPSTLRETIAQSLPVAVPLSATYNHFDEDSGVISGSSSFLTPLPSPGSSLSSSQSNSFHRRWLRNQVTSMEHGLTRRKSGDMLLNLEEPMNRRRYPKIGLGVVIALFDEADVDKRQRFQIFFFSHFTLFEGHFHRMSSAVERALTHQRRAFIPPIMDAVDEFRLAVYSLYCAPRIQRPVWLNMMTFPLQRGRLCEHLMHELLVELDQHNSKQTNFFFSRLLTVVLMYHLAWVPTVMPAESTPSRAYLDKHSSTTFDALAKSHPYNPLWAQLGDMFGAIGFPVKASKTIIVGHQSDVICRLLYILSYFIRCSEVHEIIEEREKTYPPCRGGELTEPGRGDEIDVSTRQGDLRTELSNQCNSGDSGLENSEEQLDDDDDDDEFTAMQRQEMKDGIIAAGLSRGLLEGGLSIAAVEETNSRSDETSSSRTHVVGTANSSDENKSFSLIVTEGTPPRGPSPSIYPDLNEILSTDFDSVSASPDDPKVSAVERPVVQQKVSNTLVSHRERLIAVGRDAPLAETDGMIRPHRLWDSTVDSKRGPCVEIEDGGLYEERDRSRTITNQNQTPCYESCPGHDRSPTTPIAADQPCNLGEQQMRQQQLDSPQLIVTPDASLPRSWCSQSSGTTGAPSPSPTSQRRNTRFPLTSPLAYAYQESLRARGRGKAEVDASLRESLRVGEGSLGQHGPPVARQISWEWPARTYRRCSSGCSNASSGYSDVTEHEELPMAFSELGVMSEDPRGEHYIDNFGRSLLGGYSKTYVADMVLHGVPTIDRKKVMEDLVFASQHSVLDDTIDEAVCIVADTDTWTIEVLSSERTVASPEVKMSDGVSNLLESVQQMCQLRMPSDFCLMYLEDQLQEIFYKSVALGAYLEQNPRAEHEELVNRLGFATSDLPLLLSVTSVHSPHVIQNLVRENYEKRSSDSSTASARSSPQ